MKVSGGLFTRLSISIAMSALVFTYSGCTSHPSRKHQESTTESTRATNPLERRLDGGSYCVQTFTQGPAPTTPMHFSNKVNASDGSTKDYEADLSGDSLNLTMQERHPATDFDRELVAVPGTSGLKIQDGFAETTRTNHYTRADASGWRIGANGIVLGTTPWNLFVQKPTVTQVGTESIAGYDTVKYAVDTTHQTALDKAALIMAASLKDYNITGTAWATKDTNCILQYAIDYEKTEKDGTVSKTHYEGAVTKQ